MDKTTPSPQERAEVELVLQSGIFLKAPRLARFFRYICERHLEGNADQIKEYSIAFEALGRPAEFDPKKDSIVRVEAHRLRKRLEEYYSGPGASNPIHIRIPNGQYRPYFVARHIEPGLAELPHTVNGNGNGLHIGAHTTTFIVRPVVAPESQRAEPTPRRSGRGRIRLLTALVSLVAAVVIGASIWTTAPARQPGFHKHSDEIWTGPSIEPVPSEFRMLAGYHGAPFVDIQGHTWMPDAYYEGGTAISLPPASFIEGTPDPHLLKSERSGTFRYAIPLRQGTYELHLYFAETEYGWRNPKGGGDGSRIFQVSLNNTVVLRDFDVLGEAGAPNRLHERAFKDVSPDQDGKLRLVFDGPAFLNALEILSSAPGRVHPIRIVTQPNPVTDPDGHVWAGDEYFCGGTFVSRRNVVLNANNKALFQGERYGNFFYHLPVPPGKYRLTLHFAETWFGLPGSSGPAFGSRLFNVFVNGQALLRNFEIARAAGGVNRTVAETFNNLEPNAQGVLAIEFVPVRNYAEVNAIEVVKTD